MPALATKKKEAFDLNSILSTASVSKDKKATSKVPVLSVPKETEALVTEIRQIKEELDSLKSIFELKEAELIKTIAPLREKLCMSGYVSSVKIPDSENLSVLLSWKDAYTKIAMDATAMIQDIVGDEKYPQFFQPDMTITVKDVSEGALTELIEAVGADRFAEYFEVERSLKPTSRYTTEYFIAFTGEQREKLSHYVRQYKPALKTK